MTGSNRHALAALVSHKSYPHSASDRSTPGATSLRSHEAVMANGAVKARQMRRKTSTRTTPRTAGILVSLLSFASPAVAQDNGCVSLQGSKACPAFSSASVSTGSYLVGLL